MTESVEVSEDAAVAISLGFLLGLVCLVLVFVWRWEFIAGVVVCALWARHGYKTGASPVGGDSSAE